MTPKTFEFQIMRLRKNWPHSYGEERGMLIWERVRDLPDEFMVDAVTEFIANRRAAPMLSDFMAFRTDFERRKNEQRTVGQFSSPLEVLESASKAGTADPEFVGLCLRTIRNKLDGKITDYQFSDACDALDSMATAITRKKRATRVPPLSRKDWE
jgi:hypothetical protein